MHPLMSLAILAATSVAVLQRRPSRRGPRRSRVYLGPVYDAGLGDAYRRRPLNFAPSVVRGLSPEAQLALLGRRCHLTPAAQTALFDALTQRYLGSDRSVRSVNVRRALAEVCPRVDWHGDVDQLAEAPALAWQDALQLASAVEAQVGFVPGRAAPKDLVRVEGADGVLVPRSWLELPDYDLRDLFVEQIVELLVAEAPSDEQSPVRFAHAEPVFAVTEGASMRTGAPRLRVVETFRGQDVRPRLAHRHGFEAGRRLEVRPNQPTGIRRIYASGVT